MKRFFLLTLVALLLCQNVSACQTETKPRDKTNTAALMAEKQDAADVKPNEAQGQSNQSNDGTVRQPEISLVERIGKLSSKTNWSFLISAFAVIFAGLSWASARKSLEVTHSATKAEFQPYISINDDFIMHKMLQSNGNHHHTLVVFTDGIEIKNIGKTPAMSIKLSARGKFSKQGRHFDEQATISEQKAGDMMVDDPWFCGLRFEFAFPDGDANNFERIREMDIYVTLTFTDMFTGDNIRMYVFHYFCEVVGHTMVLESVKEIKQT